MVGSEVVMGLPDDNTVYKYDVTSKSTSGIDKMESSKQTLTGTSITASGGTTEMEFIKIMSESGEIELSSTGSTILVFAVGTSNTLAYHQARSSVSINLSNCESSSLSIDSLSKFGVFMHALLMIGAWLYLIPSGILVATFKGLFGPAWVQLHMPIQVMGVLAMLCGVLVISTSLNSVNADHLNSEKTDFGVHTYLGVMALCIAGFQIFLGVTRPHKPAPNEEKPFVRLAFEVLHRGIGFIAVLVALLCVLSGIDHADSFSYINDKMPYMIAAFAPLAIFAILLLGKVTGIIDDTKKTSAKETEVN
jgi:cytochrome b561